MNKNEIAKLVTDAYLQALIDTEKNYFRNICKINFILSTKS